MGERKGRGGRPGRGRLHLNGLIILEWEEGGKEAKEDDAGTGRRKEP